MKKLTRVKLINWHRFYDAMIDFEKSTLVSGENGAGKSTLLDAIQFVVTCSTNYFNKAAHENGKRKLTGYVRCKTGRENQPYERMGEISAHIALEFYEEKKKKYFIVGAVIDSSAEGQEKTVRYLLDQTRLDDRLFYNGKTPKSIAQFRTSNAKAIKQWCKTEKDAKQMIKNRFGRIEDKFFQLIPKALAFRPIKDIKDFVYSYVLDKKELSIDILRENVRTYQDLQRTLENIKVRMEKLDQIEIHHNRILDGRCKDSMYEYFLERVAADICKNNLNVHKKEVSANEIKLQDCEKSLIDLKKEKTERQVLRDNLYTELASDQSFIAREEQKNKLDRLQLQWEELSQEKAELLKSVNRAKAGLHRLTKEPNVAKCVIEYEQLLNHFQDDLAVTDFKELIEDVIASKREMSEKIRKQIYRAEDQVRILSEQMLEVKHLIESLNKKRLSYTDNVNRLMNAIREDFAQVESVAEPKVLCELLEITDDQWRNAVEGYLNTQRFYVVVNPEQFDIALGTYDKLRKAGKAYGVGLINTQKLQKYDQAPEGSLATVVTSKNKYAKQYINMVLGKVMMCQHYSELKNHPVAITKECMRYQNHVASAIKPEIFETPYIGKNAIRVQLEQAKEKEKQLSEQMSDEKTRLRAMQEIQAPLLDEIDVDIKYRVDVLTRLKTIAFEMKQCKENIATLDQNSGMIQKRIQLETLEKLLIEIEENIGKSNKKIGSLQEKIDEIKAKIALITTQWNEKNENYQRLASAHEEDAIVWSGEYEKQTLNKGYVQFKENYDRRKKANLTQIDIHIKNMEKAMVEYQSLHGFGAAATLEGYPEYEMELMKLKTSELLTYEEKVENAKNAAEEEFREQFLAKLQENIKTAQSEFKELNKALKDIQFSNERYEFLHMPSKKYRQFYEMIMDDFNAIQGESIFSGLFHQSHKEVIDELFEKLALDSDNQAKAMDEFIDYRTYMDYDIRITHDDGNYSLYSKVCEEKSGGETQTPFYVTVAASFVQLYRNGIGGESVGLIMFDEAFNNMDDERIGGVLEFLGRLPLQIVIAAPPDKIQYISPSVEQTLLVMTDHKVSFVESYHNGTIR